MSRYLPSRTYLRAAWAAVAFGLGSTYVATRFLPVSVAAFLFFLSATVLFLLFYRPLIEVHPKYLLVGRQRIAWHQLRQVNHSGWFAPLVVDLLLQDGGRQTIVFAGDLDSSAMLLREIRFHAHGAMIDGTPHRDYWRHEGTMVEPESVATTADAKKKKMAKPTYPLLSPGDEEEVERLYHRLKSVGRLDPRDEQ